MPHGEAWPEPQPYLVAAAVALSAGRPESAAAALDAAERIFERLPADQEDAARLAVAMIRLTVSRRSGDLDAAAEAVACAEALVGRVCGGGPARQAGIRAQVLFARGAAELWSGRFGEAAGVLDAGVTAAAASGEDHERIDCLGHLALVAALRGHLARAAKLAGEATTACAGAGQRSQGQHPKPAALAALAWVHLEHHELREARRLLTQLDTALRASPDRLIGAVACLIGAYGALAEGHAQVATQFVARARSAWPVPSWLEQRLSLAESRALAAAGDIEAALAAAKRADCESSPEAAVTLAHAWVAAGDGDNARRALAPVLEAHEGYLNGCAYRHAWWMPGSAITAATAYEAVDRWGVRCGWPNVSSFGCRSPWSGAGSGRCYSVTPNWRALTSTFSGRPGVTVRCPPPRQPSMRPRSQSSSRSPNANGKCCDRSRSC